MTPEKIIKENKNTIYIVKRHFMNRGNGELKFV